jgi:phosphate acyltransferase
MEIVLDTLSGEYGPEVAVQAGIKAHKNLGLNIAFAGPSKVIQQLLKAYLPSWNVPSDVKPFRIVESSEYIRMDESVLPAIRKKPNASIRCALRDVATGLSRAVVSAGHTGATVVAAREILGLFPSVRSPALCQLMPGANDKEYLLLDVGASITVKSLDYVNFALMGHAVAKTLLGIDNPRIGLLNIGTEKNKGGKRHQGAGSLLKQLPVNFLGNVEGNDLWSDSADVYVTDATTGNVVLKSAEGLVRMILNSPGVDFSPDNVIHKRFDPSQYGGAPLLGVNGMCVVCHGQAKTEEIYHAIVIAKNWLDLGILDSVSRMLATFHTHDALKRP